MKKFLRNFLRDVATLRRPVTAASAVATIVALVSPLGIDVGPDGAKLTAVVVAAGVAAAYVESLFRRS